MVIGHAISRVGLPLLTKIKNSIKVYEYKGATNPKPTVGLNSIPDEDIARAVDLFNSGKTQEQVRKTIGFSNNHSRAIYRTLKNTNDEIYNIFRGQGTQRSGAGTTLTPEQIQYFLRNTATVGRDGISNRAIAKELNVTRDAIDHLKARIYNNPNIAKKLNDSILAGKVPGVTEPLYIQKFSGPRVQKIIAGKDPTRRGKSQGVRRQKIQTNYLKNPNVPQKEKDAMRQAYEAMKMNNALYPNEKVNVDHIRALTFFKNMEDGHSTGNVQIIDEAFNKVFKGQTLEQAKGSIRTASKKFRNARGYTEAKKYVQQIIDEYKKLENAAYKKGYFLDTTGIKDYKGRNILPSFYQ